MMDQNETPDLTPEDAAMLEALFSESAADQPEPSPELLARILSDAETVQAAALASPLPVPPATPAPGLWATIMAGLGGLPGVSGLVTATLAGLWIGYSPPTGLSAVAGTYLGTESVLEVDGLSLGFDDGGLFDADVSDG